MKILNLLSYQFNKYCHVNFLDNVYLNILDTNNSCICKLPKKKKKQYYSTVCNGLIPLEVNVEHGKKYACWYSLRIFYKTNVIGEKSLKFDRLVFHDMVDPKGMMDASLV